MHEIAARYDFKVILKMFCRWLKGNDGTFPLEISWLKPKLKNAKHKLSEDLLAEEQFLRRVEAARTLRGKTFILVLYASGCRIGENAQA